MFINLINIYTINLYTLNSLYLHFDAYAINN